MKTRRSILYCRIQTDVLLSCLNPSLSHGEPCLNKQRQPNNEFSNRPALSLARKVSKMPPYAGSPKQQTSMSPQSIIISRERKGLYGAVLEDVFSTGFTRFPATVETGTEAGPEQRLRVFIRAMFYRLQSREGWGGMSGQGRLIARELLDPSPAFVSILERYITAA